MQGKIAPAVVTALLALVAFHAAAQTAPTQPQTVIYPSSPPDHYLPSAAIPQYADSYSSTIYSPSQYPTAQGHYLQVPNTYSQQGGPPALPPGPPPSLPPSAGAYQLPVATSPQPPPAPVTVSPSPIDMPPASAPSVYPHTTGTSSAPVAYYNSNPAPAYSYGAPGAAYNSGYSAGQNPRSGPAAPPAAPVDPISLGTGTGGEIGFEISQYHYQEHVDADSQFMHLTGANYGFTGQGSKTFTQGWLKDSFLEGQLRLSYGSHDYAADNGDTANSIDDYLFDIRALLGHDFYANNLAWHLPDLDFSPYTGLGFRVLFDDGIDNSGGGFYRRYSHYLYLPVGATERVRLTENSRLSLNFEYDWLIYGWQVSQLGDWDPGANDLYNDQHQGYGLRGSLMYERRSWSIGPFFEYWNIDESTLSCSYIPLYGGNVCGSFEPHNQTIEWGLQGKFRF